MNIRSILNVLTLFSNKFKFKLFTLQTKIYRIPIAKAIMIYFSQFKISKYYAIYYRLKSLWNNFKSFLLQWGVEIFSVATIRRWNLVNPFMTNLFSLIILLHQQHEFISFTIIILLFIPFVEFYGMNKKPFNKMVYVVYNTCCFRIRKNVLKILYVVKSFSPTLSSYKL